jgi:hypothetical protein
LQKGKVDSLIPLVEEFTPALVEVWTFPEVASLQNDDQFNY